MAGFIILILTFVLLFIIGSFMLKKQEKLMREGRAIIASIEYVKPISTDESGNTTVVYILDIEGHLLKDSRKIDTFYAPQFQPGKKVKVIYKDDKNYMFIFDN